jgi:glycosyltransferase involved in cell wall biosynthesis
MNHERVSVILPTYNRARYIRSALDSAIGQTHAPCEIIVVDDGSTDETAEVCGGYGQPVTYLHKPNGGVSSARNVGIREAKGDFVAFLDSDDVWMPEKLARQVEFLSDRDFGFALSEIEYVDADDRLTGRSTFRSHLGPDGDLLRALLARPFCIASILIFRRSVIDAIGLFDESLRTAEDIDYLLRAASRFKGGLVDTPLVKYRRTPGSLSGEVFTRNRLRALAKLSSYAPEAAARYRRVIDKTVASIHVSYARDLLWARRANEARLELSESLRHRPSVEALVLLLKSRVLARASGNRPAPRA